MAALGWVRMRRGPRSLVRVLGLCVVFMIFAGLVESYFLGLWPSHSTKRPSDHPTAPSKSPLEKPRGYKIIGLIFYGRRDRAAILDCYLKENLAINGGWLDEVVWGVNTDNTDDLVYLEELVPTSPYYRRLDLKEKGYVNLWNQSVESGNIYIKIDDDVVYISPDAIPLIVHTLTTQEKAVVVSANVVNSPEHNWIHYRTGAVQPYLPEFDVPAPGSLSTLENPVWRVADFPSWIGPPGWASPGVGEFTEVIKKLLPPRPDGDHATELPLHRWLPLDDSGEIYKTPIAQTSYNPYGAGWTSWAIAAQQHYSFFRNLELGRLSAYHMIHGEGRQTSALWDHTGDRLSINMLAVRGDVVLDNIDTMATAESDEAYLSMDLPRQLGKRKHFYHISPAR